MQEPQPVDVHNSIWQEHFGAHLSRQLKIIKIDICIFVAPYVLWFKLWITAEMQSKQTETNGKRERKRGNGLEKITTFEQLHDRQTFLKPS